MRLIRFNNLLTIDKHFFLKKKEKQPAIIKTVHLKKKT